MRNLESPPPPWIVVLIGALIVSPEAVQKAAASPRSRAPEAWPARFVRDPGRRELCDMCPRELRGLPGLGQVRAVEVARAGWLHGSEPFLLEDVPGIGVLTARRVEAWLEDVR